MVDIIEVLLKGDYFGGGKYIEIAKGKNEFVDNWHDAKIKIKRLWLSKK